MTTHKEHNNYVFIIITLVALLAIAAFILALPEKSIIENETWDCVQTQCSQYLTEDEIVAQVCSQTDQGLLCSINIDRESTIIPREQLNLTSLRFCKQEICVKEIRTRPANYTI